MWAACLAVVLLATGPAPAQSTTQPADDGQEFVRDPGIQPAEGQQPADQKPAEEGKGEQKGQDQQPEPSFLQRYGLFLMLGAFVLLYLVMGRSRRKQEAKRKEMLASLKKGDKVTSIGGIVGTIIEIKEDEVTVKVDESNNVRMKFARWAIRGVGEESKADPSQKK